MALFQTSSSSAICCTLLASSSNSSSTSTPVEEEIFEPRMPLALLGVDSVFRLSLQGPRNEVLRIIAHLLPPRRTEIVPGLLVVLHDIVDAIIAEWFVPAE